MLTLFKLFLFPRLKTLFVQFFAVMSALFISFWTGQAMLVLFCFGILVSLIYYNFLSANLSDNIEWVKNSLVKSKKLLGYYFLEQTIFAFVTSMLLVLSISIMGWTLSKMDSKIFDKEDIRQSLASQGKIEEKMETMKSYGATEMSLELIFLLLMLVEVFYGAELVKSYFLTLKYEKKFSKETIIFQGMLFLSFIFIALKDSYSMFWITHAKIFFIPLFMGFGFLIVLHAANEGYKLFRRRWNSPLLYYPASLTAVTMIVCLIFSKINYNVANDLNNKISEHRFQFIFAPKLNKETLMSWYKSDLDESSMAYLVNVHPLKTYTNEDLKEIILAQNSTDSLLLLSKMIKFDQLDQNQKQVFENQFLALNKDNHPNKQNSSMAKFNKMMNKDIERLPASQTK